MSCQLATILVAILSHATTGASGEHRAAETRIEMRRVNLHPDDTVTLYVNHLNGKLAPTQPGTIPVFDDKNSFAIAIDSAEITISSAALTSMLNLYVFADPKSPIRNVKISIDGRQLKQTGTLHKGVDLPFEMEGTIATTNDGNIRIHPKKLKVAHLPVKGLLDLFGVETDDLVSGKHVRAMRVEHEDLILDPEELIPAPKIHGRLRGVRLIKDALVETYGDGSNSRESGNRNYIAYRGGTIRFGKLTMTDADLKLIDASARDPFDFSVDHYKDQLVAGYSKTTPASGLEVFMPDYYKVRKAAGAKTPQLSK